MTCQNPGAACPRLATVLARIRPTGTQRAFCRECFATLTALGLDIVPVETGWRARAIEAKLPTRVEMGR